MTFRSKSILERNVIIDFEAQPAQSVHVSENSFGLLSKFSAVCSGVSAAVAFSLSVVVVILPSSEYGLRHYICSAYVHKYILLWFICLCGILSTSFQMLPGTYTKHLFNFRIPAADN